MNTDTFESNESGASLTYPAQAGTIKKGSHVLLKGKPCKVVDVSTSKTGKHGHAKAHFDAWRTAYRFTSMHVRQSDY